MIVTNTAQRFGELPWHDSKLLALSIYRSNSEDRVSLRVSLRQSGPDTKVTDVVFLGSTYCEATIDLGGKRACSDDISSGSCYASSAWLQELTKSHPYDSFDGFFHFRLYLIPPGGFINILAKEFVLQEPLDG
jgi:hypothetical protein